MHFLLESADPVDQLVSVRFRLAFAVEQAPDLLDVALDEVLLVLPGLRRNQAHLVISIGGGGGGGVGNVPSAIFLELVLDHMVLMVRGKLRLLQLCELGSIIALSSRELMILIIIRAKDIQILSSNIIISLPHLILLLSLLKWLLRMRALKLSRICW